MMAGGVPYGELTEIKRQGETPNRIVRACVAIKDGVPFEACDAVNLDAGDNLRVLEAASPAESIDTLQAVLEYLGRTDLFHPVKATQVIVGVNDKGELSRTALNDRLQAALNPDGKRVEPNPFRVGDKIICLKNGNVAKVRLAESSHVGGDPTNPVYWSAFRDPVSGSPAEQYVANGEIGFVEAVGDRVMVARFSEGETCVRIPVGRKKRGDGELDGGDRPHDGDEREAKGRGCDFDLAYAITVHKAQGSESPCIIIMADEQAGRVASREWHYTAVSRASKLCIYIGSRKTIDGQARRVSLKRRKTFLADLVREAIA